MSNYTSRPLKMLEKTKNGVRIATADGKKVIGMAWTGLVDSGLPSRTEAEANAALWIAAPETAAERDRLKAVNAALLEACELSNWAHYRYKKCEPCPYHQRYGCPYPGETRQICSRCVAEVCRIAIVKASEESNV